jgi:glycosyltransferase involved in cell wall biosynthesis
MHILLIHQTFVSPEEAGGTRHFELMSRLVQSGHRATIVASNLSYLSGQKCVEGSRLVTEQRMDGICVLRAYTYPSLHRSFIWRVVSFLSFMVTATWAGWKAGKVDLVMGTSPPLFQTISAWIVTCLRRRPLLLEIRDLWPEFGIDLGVLKHPLIIWLARRLEMFVYRRATHMLVNSPAYRDYLISKGVPRRKISFIANGVDPALFHPSTDGGRLRKELRLDGKFVVTYAGALGISNDIETLLKGAAELREQDDIHFLLVGDGKERGNLESLAAHLKLANVTFTGAMPKRRMPEVLAASDVCVAILKNIRMFTTTYPNKVFDYMAAGRPTILAIDGVIRQVVEAAGGGIFVPPGDWLGLGSAIRRLHSDRAAGRAMGERARCYVEKHFNRAQQADQLCGLLERLTAKSSTRLDTIEDQREDLATINFFQQGVRTSA